MSGPEGLLVVDKPPGWTSHDVVAKVRRIAGTRRVGHAGTLDPMATGVLVLGLGRGTRLLGHLSGHDKTYLATARLGRSTDTDDAEGGLLAAADGAALAEPDVRAAAAELTGRIEQVPPAYSAVQVEGRRAYARARAGEQVALAARSVVVHELAVLGLRRGEDEHGGYLDVDLRVHCSAGTYVRALARDLGRRLGVGGHLTALRRTRSGCFTVEQARPLAELETDLGLLALPAAVSTAFPRRDVGDADALALAHGRPLAASGTAGPVGVFGPAGELLALVADRDGYARPLAVFVG